MTKAQRIPARQLSRKLLSADSVQSEYSAGYCHFIVTSQFLDIEKLEELLYQIILQKQMESGEFKQHDPLAKGAPI